MAKDDPGAVTPAAAVARHLEWLEFALEAARDEEIRRRGRLEKATDKNRSKRTVRLGEVAAEIRELSALVSGLKDLQARAAAVPPPAAAAPARRGRRPAAGTTTGRARKATGGPASKAAAPAAAKATAPKATASKATAPSATAAPKPRPRKPRTAPPPA